MGPQRISRIISFFPRPRTLRPTFSSFQISSFEGLSITGGVSSQKLLDDFTRAREALPQIRNSWPHLWLENFWISATERCVSV